MADSVKIRIEGDDAPFQKTLSGLGKVAGTAFKGLAKGVGALSAAWSIAGVTVVKAGSDFTSSMSEVQAISGATAEEFQLLEQTAKDYGASTSFSASQAADALKYMALAGWDAQKSVDALPGVLNLAAASGMELGAASDMVTDYLSAFGMEASKAGYFSDLLAHAQSTSNTTATALGEAYRNCAANLNAAGQDVETVTAALMGMANQGLKGSVAGTAMAAIMRDIGNQMRNGAIQIGKTSVAVQDAQGNYRDLTDIMIDVQAATEGMGTAERTAALSSTFTADSIRGVNMILQEGAQNIAAYEEGLRGATGAAEEMADVMLDNLSGDITMFKSALEGLQISAFEGMEGPARKAVQTATDVISQMNEAYQKGGLDGLVDNINKQIPKLTTAGVNAASKLFAGISKKLPGLVKGLLSNLPQLLSSAAELSPQLADSLFSMIGVALETVASQLPELAPILWKGALSLLESVGRGIFGALDSLTRGIEKALGIEFNGFTGLEDLADKNLMDQLSQYIDGEIDTSGLDVAENTLTERINTLFANIRGVLTDGAPDTDEVLNPLKEETEEIVGQLYSDIDTWEQTEIAQLDPEAPDFSTACANIKAEAQSARDDVASLHDGILAYIDSMAGKSAASVEASIGQLESMTSELEKISERYKRAAQELSPEANAYKTVRAGAGTDEQTVGLAIDYVVANYKLDMQSAQDSYDQTIADINEQVAKGELSADEAVTFKEQADVQLELDQAAAEQSYRNGAIELMNGLTKTLTEEQRNALDAYAANSTLQQDVADTFAKLMKGEITPAEIPDNVIQAMLGLNAPGTAEAIQRAVETGLPTADLALIFGALATRLQQEAAQIGENADFDLMATVWGSLVENGGSTDMGYSLDELVSGLLGGTITPVQLPIEGEADLSLTNGSDLPQQVEDGVKDEMPIAVDVPIEADPEVTPAEGAQEEVAQAAEQTAEASAEPTPVPVPVTAEPQVTVAEDSGIQEAVDAQLQGQTMSVDVQADVKLSVKVSDSNASEVGTTAGQEISTGIAGGITAGSGQVQTAARGVASSAASSVRSQTSSFTSAGRSFSAGLAAGISAGRSGVISAAAAVARAAAAAARSALAIHSPSKVTEGFGEYFDLGFVRGVERNASLVSKSATNMAQIAASAVDGVIGAANFDPRFNSGSFLSSLSSTLAGNTQDLLAMEGDRPIRLYVNGRELGRVMAEDNAGALSEFSRARAFGYGKR